MTLFDTLITIYIILVCLGISFYATIKFANWWIDNGYNLFLAIGLILFVFGTLLGLFIYFTQ